jgi:hypothetical protein
MLSLDDPRFRLNNLLGRYDELVTRAKPGLPAAQAQRAAIAESFDQKVRDTIRPAMQEIGDELIRRGHDYEMLIAPGSHITMNLYPAPLVQRAVYAAPCIPYVSFMTDALTANIHVVHSTMLPNGRGCAEITDTLSLDQVTCHYVEAQICEVLRKVLGAAEG